MIPQKREQHLKQLISRLDISLNNLEQLSIALTHPSFLLEKEGSHILINNQRLEYLGDAVVDLVVGQYLFEEFPEKPEGELTKMRAALVCEASLASAARRVGLGE
ncbi:MAG: ribonuclease III, partial [Peptococcaceae bacterium]|nr:ribonuclease III [Peptococcaceae bacterium]